MGSTYARRSFLLKSQGSVPGPVRKSKLPSNSRENERLSFPPRGIELEAGASSDYSGSQDVSIIIREVISDN